MKTKNRPVSEEGTKRLSSFTPRPTSLKTPSFDSTRVLTGLILLAMVLVVLSVPHPLPLTLVVWALGMVGIWEYLNLIGLASWIRMGTALLSFSLIIFGCYLKDFPVILGALSLPFLCFTRSLFIFDKGPEEWPEIRNSLGLFVMAPLYLGLALGLAVLYKSRGEIWPLIFVASAVWAGDTGAYYVGKTIGKHLLHPLSPEKTWEGTLGGLITGATIAMAAGLLGRLFPWWEGLILGALVNISGQLGDLLESLLKRVAGVKDSGTLFPGHGGVLDRVDSFLLALPFYALITGLISLI